MTVGRGLLDRLSSPDPGRREDTMASVVTNLLSILNTHQGDGFTCPDMGCDFIELLSRWPTSETDVLVAVKRSIERYETRLGNVQVRRASRDDTRVEIQITGLLEDRNRVEFRTELARAGRIGIG